MSYEPRESINPRTFALRHALLEELKHRQRGGGALRDEWTALARALDVSYEPETRQFVVRGVGGASQRVPFGAMQLYESRADVGRGDWRREDEVLRANRTLAAHLIDALLGGPSLEAP
ncbi:MAG: hypothetical protein H3C62_05275 [Gemmatimonadaceae bacterium]|nr:hypothetical protein [Gemmatimonadaceae bacterium]